VAAAKPAQNFTDQYLTDRAAMLSWVVQRNTQDNTALVIKANSEALFQDVGTSTVFRIGSSTTGDADRRVFRFANDIATPLTGNTKNDALYGGAGADTLDGRAGDDYLEGGAGNDTYTFKASFGKDTVVDSDGVGRIVVGSQTLGKASASLLRANQWDFKLDSGQWVYMNVYDDASSSTGKRLVITQEGDTTNSITVNHFDVDKAKTATGYLGIKFGSTPKLAVVKSAGTNVWSDKDFTLATLAGRTTSIKEGTGCTFTLCLNEPAKAGDTITLALAGQGDKFKALVNGSKVDANGAVITLVEGQTQVSLALVQEGELTADGNASLSATYSGQAGSATSNVWGLDLKDSGQTTRIINGDQDLLPDRPFYGWTPDGNLIGGVAASDYSDGIHGDNAFWVGANDEINGFGGNDGLNGGYGNDTINGGTGDDLIGGGTGSDKIYGGDGNDYISSSSTLWGIARWTSNAYENGVYVGDKIRAPEGSTVITQGARWSIYRPAGAAPDSPLIWDGVNTPVGTDGDFVDGGAGNDSIIASNGDDRVQGGTGDDKIWGMGGSDVLEGGDGKDLILADGTAGAGAMTRVAVALHGADFVDGGAGDDRLIGGGANDVVYGGADNDQMWGDGSLDTSNDAYVSAAYHGNDYLDGEDGDDYLEGGGKDDVLYGGANNDTLWGDTSVSNVTNPADNALIWGNDYLRDFVRSLCLSASSSMSSNMSLPLRPKASASRYTDAREGCCSPRSSLEMKFLFNSATSAKCSCVHPNSARKRRSAVPKRRGSCLSSMPVKGASPKDKDKQPIDTL
jgi:Ca2+-binding RTX toxin-like protein